MEVRKLTAKATSGGIQGSTVTPESGKNMETSCGAGRVKKHDHVFFRVTIAEPPVRVKTGAPFPPVAGYGTIKLSVSPAPNPGQAYAP